MSKKPLTEADLLKMSEKDYMNAAQLEFFKTKLLALKADLLMHANETTEHLRENVLVPDPADRATIEEEHALELRTRDRERKLLKKVEQSLLSIEYNLHHSMYLHPDSMKNHCCQIDPVYLIHLSYFSIF